MNLALSIPTCNHPLLIETGLSAMLPELKKLSIPVYISDNSDTDATERVVTRLREEYANIYYRRNTTNIGYDANFYQALTWPNTEFVWPLADGMIVQKEGFSQIIAMLSPDLDMIFVNDRVDNIASQHVADQELPVFLRKIAWHITLLGATIYGRSVRALVVSDQQKTHWKNFFHLGYILCFCSTQSSVRALWYSPQILKGNPEKKSSGWVNIPIQVFVGDWAHLIMSFSEYFSEEGSKEIILSHARYTRLFTSRNLLELRHRDVFDVALYRTYRSEIMLAIPLPLWWLGIIARLPKKVAYFLRFLF